MALALNGTAIAASATTASSITSGIFTPTLTNNILVAFVCFDTTVAQLAQTVSTVTNTGFGGALTWTKRSSLAFKLINDQLQNGRLEVWWAKLAPTTAGTVTANLSGTCDNINITVFAVNGVDQTNPWDFNGSLPGTNTNLTLTNSIPTVSSISTTNANTMLLGFAGEIDGTATITMTAGSGYTIIINKLDNAGSVACASFTERQIVSSTQSGVNVVFGTSKPAWGMIADALQAATSGTPTNQYSWPNPTSPVWNSGYIYYSEQLVNLPNPKPQNNQTDWPNPLRTNWYQSWEETGNVRLPFNTPFLPLDQSLPLLGQRLQDYTWIQRSLLISTTSPFYQTDWPLPGQIQQPVQTWVFFSGQLVNLPNPKPFNQADYPNPLPVKWYQDYEENLLQYTLVPIVVNPFRQQDWPNPAPVNWFQFWYNSLAQLLLPPFSQHYWPLTKAQQPIDQSWFQNLLETTLFVLTPFVQRDWPNPRIPQQPILIWTNGLPPGVINIHGVPFVQSDWPLPRTNQPIDQYWYTDTALLPIPTPITEIITGGRQIWEIELDDLTLATHKWHQRLIDAAKPGTTGEDIRAIASKLGKLGGHARAEAMTQKQRTQQASKAALTRWRPK